MACELRYVAAAARTAAASSPELRRAQRALSLAEQGADLLAPAGVGDLPAGPRRRLQRALEVDDRFVAAVGLGEVLAVEEVRIDALAD